jgi:hypothetical protein
VSLSYCSYLSKELYLCPKLLPLYCPSRGEEKRGACVERSSFLSFLDSIDSLQYLISELGTKNHHLIVEDLVTLISAIVGADIDIMDGRYRKIGNGNNSVDESLFGSGPRKTTAAKK